MLDLDPEQVMKALAEQPGEAFVSVPRPGRPGTLVSRPLAEWFVLEAPAPVDADVDVLLSGEPKLRAAGGSA